MSAPEPGGGLEEIHLEAEASGDSRIYQAGRDQHLYFSDGPRRVRRAPQAAAGDECPYPGLAAFDFRQAEWFFGRDGLTANLVTRLGDCLTDGGLVMVVAPSGAGKSSLLQAGLRNAITQGKLPAAGARDWPQVVFTPTAHPMQQAAALLAELDDSAGPEEFAPDGDQLTGMLHRGLDARTRRGLPAEKAIIIVDQLEELFTLCVNDGERRAFIDWLCGLTQPAGRELMRAAVVCGLRADFYAECANYPQLRRALTSGQVLVGPMSRAELREVIMFPAQAAGLDMESGLVELLLRDLGGMPGDDGHADSGAADYDAGRLPLLAHALRATWQQRHGSILTVDGYNTTGGIQHAIATTAEQAFNSLNAAGQDCARTLFLRLVHISDTGDDARRPADRDELLSDGRASAITRQVLDAYTRCRLLTQARDTVEITHEALLRAWPRLRRWIDEDRAGNLIRQELEQAAAAWNRNQHDKGRLHRGSRLEVARRWAASPIHDLSPTASAFLSASVRHERRAAKLRRGAVAALAISLAIAVALAGFAFAQRSNAVHERDQAIAARDLASFNQVAAEGLQLAGSDTSLAAELDLTAYQMRHTPDLASRLLSFENMPLAASIPAGHGLIYSVAVSPDSRTLAMGSYDGTVELWNVADATRPHLAGQLHTTSSVLTVAFNTDGSMLAVGSRAGAVTLWNVTDPTRPRQLGNAITEKSGFVGIVAFSPDGRTLAIQDGYSVGLWDLADPAHPRQVGRPLSGSQLGIAAIAFSPDGHTLAAADGDNTTWLWNLASPAQSLHFGHPQPVTQATANDAVAYSPDGRTLAIGGNNGEIQIWNIADAAAPRMLGQPLTGGADAVLGLQFSRDGQVLASGNQDGTIRLWAIGDPAQPEPLGLPVTGGTGGIQAATISPNGHLLISGSVAGVIQVWSLPSTVLPSPAPVDSVALSHHGRVLAAGSRDGAITLWDVTNYARPRRLGRPIAGGIGSIWSVAFSPDGHIMAGSGDNGRIQLWDVTDPAHPRPQGRPLNVGTEQVWSVAFSPTGRTLASADYDGTVQLWDVMDPASAHALGPPLDINVDNPNSISFRSDGNILAFGGWGTQANHENGVVELWDVANPADPQLLEDLPSGTNLARAVAFSPNTRILVSGNYDGSVQYWLRRKSGHTSPLAPQIGGIYAAAFSPNSRTLATGGATGLQLWDVTAPGRPQLAGQPLTGYNSWINSVAFSPDGNTLISGSQDDAVRLWNLNVNDAITWICNTTSNVLTRQQWLKYVPGLPYRPPCRN